jgi:hypothetical protein
MGHGGKSAQRLRDSKQGVRVLQPDQGAEALLQSGVPMVVGAWPTGRPALLAINPAARHAQGQIRSKTGEGSLHAASVESKHLAHGGWGDGFPSLLLAASCAACRRMGVSCPALAVLVMLSRCPTTYFYVCELHGASTQRRFDPEALRLHFSDGVKVPLLHSTWRAV